MKTKNINGFSLIEVIVASSILMISIFGVYKLISENGRLIHNRSNFIRSEIMLYNIKNCIDVLGLPYFSGSLQTEYSFNFGIDGLGCYSGLYSSDYSFTGVSLNDTTYYLYGLITNSGSNFIDWDLGVYEENVGEIKRTYRQIK